MRYTSSEILDILTTALTGDSFVIVNLPEIEFSDLILEFQLDEDYANWKIIVDWLYTNKNFDSAIGDLIFSDVSIQLGDEKKNIIYTVQLLKIFPYSISEINFNTRVSDIDPLIFTVTFKINNLEFK